VKLEDETEEIEVEEIVVEEKEPKKKIKRGESYGLPSWIIDRDLPAIPEEIAEALGERSEQVQEVKADKVLLRGLSKTNNTMKVLKFLYDRNNAFYIQEIARGLGMWEGTARPNLIKLEELGIVVQRKFKGNTYFYIPEVNRGVAKLAIIMWKQRISYKLAHYIPYDKVKEEDLKEDKRFLEKCKYFGLTVDEGLEAVLECPKIVSERKSNILYLWRKEPQGYIPPKSEEEEIEVEEFITEE